MRWNRCSCYISWLVEGIDCRRRYDKISLLAYITLPYPHSTSY